MPETPAATGSGSYRRDRPEPERGQRVGEERGPELRRSAEKSYDHESRGVQPATTRKGPTRSTRGMARGSLTFPERVRYTK